MTVAVVAGYLWPALGSVAPRLVRSTRQLVASRAEPTGPATAEDPAALARSLREEAAALGISALGVTSYDPRYQFTDGSGTDPAGDRVIVCVLEQNYEATQRIPSERSEQAALSTYAQLQDRLAKL